MCAARFSRSKSILISQNKRSNTHVNVRARVDAERVTRRSSARSAQIRVLKSACARARAAIATLLTARWRAARRGRGAHAFRRAARACGATRIVCARNSREARGVFRVVEAATAIATAAATMAATMAAAAATTAVDGGGGDDGSDGYEHAAFRRSTICARAHASLRFFFLLACKNDNEHCESMARRRRQRRRQRRQRRRQPPALPPSPPSSKRTRKRRQCDEF